MNNLKTIFSKLIVHDQQNKNINMTFGIIAIAGLVMCILGGIIEQSAVMLIGLLACSVFSFVLLFRWVYASQRRGSLKKSLEIMERTGSIRYVDEILNEQYEQYNKECLSEHIYYIQGNLILGYDDIIDIRRVNNEYFFVTITGKQLRVMAPKIKENTINYLLNTYDITSGASYKSYKHKIEAFKNGVGK